MQDSFDALQEGLADQFGVEEAAGRHGAVAEHDEVSPGGVGGYVAGLCQQCRDAVQEPLPVGQDGLVDRMGGVRVFGRRVEEGAAAEAGGPDAFGDGQADGADLVG